MPQYGRTSRTVSRRRSPQRNSSRRVVGRTQSPRGRAQPSRGRRATTQQIRGRRTVNGRVSRPIMGRRSAGLRRPQRQSNIRRGRTLNRIRRGGNILCAGQMMKCPTNSCTGDCIPASAVNQVM